MQKIKSSVLPLINDGELDLTIDLKRLDTGKIAIVACRDVVLFPGMPIPLPIRREKSKKAITRANADDQYIALFTQSTDTDDPAIKDLYRIGVIGEIIRMIEMPDGSAQAFVQPRRACRLERLWAVDPYLVGEVTLFESNGTPREKTVKWLDALMTNVRGYIGELASYEGNPLPNEVMYVVENYGDNPEYLGTFLCSAFPMYVAQRQNLLAEQNLKTRFTMLSIAIADELQRMRVRNSVHQKTQSAIQDFQREHYLHQEMQVIQEELGEGVMEDVERLEQKAKDLSLPAEARLKFKTELNKLRRTPEQSPDYGVAFSYLTTLTDLPWGKMTNDSLNLSAAERVLNRDHYGLEKVKERILEHLAVLKMRGDMKAPILCLCGPPGVGKTSLGRSIASALRRKYVRVSLGGLHDEAEIRGHRRTYIGAMPGRILSGLIKSCSDNPVFVLDEIDKLASDFKGDPSSALLEVLDPEQNTTFHDNYLDLDYDLSHVLFIATANSLSGIAEPLRDRMEIIELSSYVMEEKVEIAERHLLAKQKVEHGLKDVPFAIPRRTMEELITRYTREAGVRSLERNIAKVLRKVAKKVAMGEPYPKKLNEKELEEYLGAPVFTPDSIDEGDYAGVVNGLAWTAAGGCTLLVEATPVCGKGGKLTLTGQLGDVMKESATLAMQWVRSNSDLLHIPEQAWQQTGIHVHCPEGAIPKDGPSAGITMATAIASAFTQRRIRCRVAMTGEITLRGRVLPVGGIKEKVLAAARAGIRDIVLCADNRKDVGEIKAEYLKGLTFHYVRDMREVIEFALLPEQVADPKSVC